MGFFKDTVDEIKDSRKIHYNLKPITDREMVQEIINYFLGEEWYVVDPLATVQVNAIALDEIKAKYPIPVRKIIFKHLAELFKQKSKKV